MPRAHNFLLTALLGSIFLGAALDIFFLHNATQSVLVTLILIVPVVTAALYLLLKILSKIFGPITRRLPKFKLIPILTTLTIFVLFGAAIYTVDRHAIHLRQETVPATIIENHDALKDRCAAKGLNDPAYCHETIITAQFAYEGIDYSYRLRNYHRTGPLTLNPAAFPIGSETTLYYDPLYFSNDRISHLPYQKPSYLFPGLLALILLGFLLIEKR